MSFISENEAKEYLSHNFSSLKTKTNTLDELYPDVNKDLVALVKRMLEFNPFFRISAADALKNKIFNGIRVP